MACQIDLLCGVQVFKRGMSDNPRGYPDEIELKVKDEVSTYSDDTTFNTLDQQTVAHDLLEQWPIQFKGLAADADYSRQLVPNVLETYFGPADEDLTFGEIEGLGGWDQFLDQKESSLEISDLPDNKLFTKREVEMYVQGREDALRDALQEAYEQGRADEKAELEAHG